jgi:hypothetical protein
MSPAVVVRSYRWSIGFSGLVLWIGCAGFERQPAKDCCDTLALPYCCCDTLAAPLQVLCMRHAVPQSSLPVCTVLQEGSAVRPAALGVWSRPVIFRLRRGFDLQQIMYDQWS